jgi:hypothetical protein
MEFVSEGCFDLANYRHSDVKFTGVSHPCTPLLPAS